MKTTSHLQILALATYCAFGQESALAGELVFADGDALSGSPAGVSEEGHLLWTSPLFLNDSSPFLSKKIDSIQLKRLRPPQQAETVATITFQNRIDKAFDVMEAELLSFDDETVKLRTWYAGDLTLKRSMLHMIEVTTEAPAIINGPGRMEDWNAIDDTDAWKIDGKNLVSATRGSIARDLPQLPDRIKIEFDLSFDYSPYLRVYLFANSGNDPTPDSTYSITIQRSSIQFSKQVESRSVPLQMGVFGQRHNFQEGSVSAVEFFIDREAGEFHLYLDGNLVSSATDPDPLKDDDWFHLSTLRGIEQTLSNFAIRPWDGNLPKRRDYLDFRQKLPMEGEQIELHNGDTIVGKATSITEGKLQIETEYVPVAVPIERLRSFQITSKENREEPRLYREDVRAYFHHGGHVTLRLEELDAATITGYSQVFGKATFDLKAFTHVEFNPYDPKFRKLRGLSY